MKHHHIVYNPIIGLSKSNVGYIQFALIFAYIFILPFFISQQSTMLHQYILKIKKILVGF